MDADRDALRPKMSAERIDIASRLGRALADRPEIAFAYVHGSFAEGLPHREIDVAVFLEPTGVARDPFDNAADLAVALTRLIGQVVDVQVLNDAPVGFQHAVLQGVVILARDEVALADHIERIATEYMDYAELARRHLRELLRP